AGIERRMETKHAALFHIRTRRQHHISCENDGKRVDPQVLHLDQSIELRDKKRGVHNRVEFPADAVAKYPGRVLGHHYDQRLEQLGRLQNRMPLRRHGVRKLRPLHGVGELGKSVRVLGGPEIRRVVDVRYDGGRTQNNWISLFILISLKQQSYRLELRRNVGAAACFWISAHHVERESLAFKRE